MVNVGDLGPVNVCCGAYPGHRDRCRGGRVAEQTDAERLAIAGRTLRWWLDGGPPADTGMGRDEAARVVLDTLARKTAVAEAATAAVLAWERATTTVEDVRRLYPWLGAAMDKLAEAVEADASDTKVER